MFQIKAIVILLITIFDVRTIVEGKLEYKLAFMDNVESCPDYKNKMLDALKMVMASEGLGLKGSMEVKADIPEEAKIRMEMYKETDHGVEYVGQVESNLCESFENEDAPWGPVVKAMDLHGCPMPVKIFEIEEVIISLDFAKDVMCHEYVGGYIVKIIIEDNSNPPEIIVCYQVQLALLEEEE